MKGPIKVVSRMLKFCMYVVLFSILPLNSCKGIVSSQMQESKTTMEIENILNENYSGFEQEKYRLIRNEEDLHSFYGVINRTRKPGITPPKIDFKKHMILIWCGDKNASNFAELEIMENKENIIVRKLNNTQGIEQNRSVVNPFSVYKLPLRSKSLRIQR